MATNLENVEYSGISLKIHGILREFCATSVKTDFVLWVQPVSSNPCAAKCIFCARKLLIQAIWDDRLLLVTRVVADVE